MNWPGVARWAALVLGVLLVVLVATSEVVWKRGWWVFTTELVLPAFVGVAGTAVAAAAWLTSRRSADIAEAATTAEHAREDRAARVDVLRQARIWLEAGWTTATGFGIEPRALDDERARAGALYGAMMLEVEVAHEASDIHELLVEAADWLARVRSISEEEFTGDVIDGGIVLLKPGTGERWREFIRDTRIEQAIIESALAEWARDSDAGSQRASEVVWRVRGWRN